MSRRVTSTNPKPSKIPRPVLTASKDVAGVRSNTNHTEGVDILTSRPVFTSDEMRDLWEIAELHSLRELKIKIAEVIIDEKGLLIKTKGLHPLRELTTAITEMTTVGKELLIMAKGQNIHQGLNAEELDSIKAHLHARREKAKIDEMKARNELLELELAQHAKDLAQATLEKQKRRECDLMLVVRMNDSVDDLVAGEMHLSHEAHLVQRVSNICAGFGSPGHERGSDERPRAGSESG
ncbi:unnamed protein product [Rhizoctonia solani]|uniref:Uncharacterized protein n=1 Tax=Rhizoctonia solani TaxID=456999 RepID=A0A8H3D9U2_9AGAM|nr:unnamed protein product [Rhizoctonia solani]